MIFANWFTESLIPFLLAILSFIESLIPFLLAILPAAVWLAFWLFAVNWKKVWPVLAEGAWVPCLLLMFLAALVWSRIAPGPCDCLGFVRLPNFWWQLGYVSAVGACALFAGWLQGVIHYTPVEVPIEPPAHHDHHHEHGHGDH